MILQLKSLNQHALTMNKVWTTNFLQETEPIIAEGVWSTNLK